MNANEAAEAQAAQEVEVVEPVEGEVTEPVAKEPEEVTLESDVVEEKEVTVEELQEQIKGLEAKVKKGKDISSQRGQAEKEANDAKAHEENVSEFFNDNLQDMVENGITDEALATATELGMTPEALELQVLKAEKSQNAIFAEVGGKEKYFEAVEGLTDVYTAEQKEAYTRGMQDPVLAKMLAKHLMADYKALGKNQTSLSDNAVVTTAGSNAYSNRAEYAKDMAQMRKAPTSQQGKLQKAIDAKLGRSDKSKLMN